MMSSRAPGCIPRINVIRVNHLGVLGGATCSSLEVRKKSERDSLQPIAVREALAAFSHRKPYPQPANMCSGVPSGGAGESL